MSGNRAAQDLTAFECHQHAAARKWVYERCCVADCQESSGRNDAPAPESFESDGQPGGARPCALKRLRRSPIFHDDLAHHSFSITNARAHVARRSDEAEIAQTIFDAA